MKKCFVVMPFSKTESCTEDQWTEIFEEVIKPSVEESGFGYQCIRSDVVPGAIIDHIIDNLNNSEIVIADLTDRNPNVFYELGVRHALKQGTILITQDFSHVPSDIRHYGVVEYNTTPKGVKTFKKKIKKHIEQIESDTSIVDNPVTNYLRRSNIQIITNKKIQDIVEEKTTSKIADVKKQFELSYKQIIDRLETSKNDVGNEEFDISGIYIGPTGQLELNVDDIDVHGRYDYGNEFEVTEPRMGELNGILHDDIISFDYFFNNFDNESHSGCGFFKVHNYGQHLEGYYLENVKYQSTTIEEIESEGHIWNFSRA